VRISKPVVQMTRDDRVVLGRLEENAPLIMHIGDAIGVASGPEEIPEGGTDVSPQTLVATDGTIAPGREGG
jgi:hypothetical protein